MNLKTRRGRFVLLWTLSLVVAVESQAAIQLQLVSRGASIKTVHGRLVLRSIPDPRAANQQPVNRAIDFTGDTVAINEAPGSHWGVMLQAPGFWASPLDLTLPPSDQSQEVQLTVWQTTTLGGRLLLPKNAHPPKVVTVAVESPPQPSRKPDIARGTQFDCDVADDGSWTCVVPATTLDLVIRLKGYAPVYRWDVALAAGHATNLGDLRLQEGASVTAWLDTESAKLLKEPATATLTRMIAPDASQTAARLATPVAQAIFDSRGMVQLLSLPAGTYVLSVTAKGFMPAHAFPLEVFRGSETALRKAIKLDAPMTVRVSVRPPKDPNGKPWLVELRRLSDFGAGYDMPPPTRKEVNATGLVEVQNQAPGLFQATVSDHNGSVYVRRDLDFRESHSGDNVIEVQLVSVHGKVVMGDDPFSSDLWFGQRNASVSVRLTTDPEGIFQGALPHDGPWSVQVIGRSQKLQTVLPVSVGSDDLIIRIPDTTVKGVVVDAAGGPVDRVEVAANASGRRVSIRADADGTFAFRGLPETAVSLEAHDLRTGRRSRSVETVLKSGEPQEGIVLRIEPDHQLSGHVVSRGVPVVGARITVYAFIDRSAQQFRAVSDERGTFDLQIPDAAQHAWIVVGAPGKTLQSYDISLTSDPFTLDLEPVGGTLVVSWPKTSLPPNIARAGAPLMLPDLAAWARLQGEPLQGSRLRVPNVAPGPYQACSPVKGADGKFQMRCAEGTLAPGGTLVLDITQMNE